MAEATAAEAPAVDCCGSANSADAAAADGTAFFLLLLDRLIDELFEDELGFFLLLALFAAAADADVGSSASAPAGNDALLVARECVAEGEDGGFLMEEDEAALPLLEDTPSDLRERLRGLEAEEGVDASLLLVLEEEAATAAAAAAAVVVDGAAELVVAVVPLLIFRVVFCSACASSFVKSFVDDCRW